MTEEIKAWRALSLFRAETKCLHLSVRRPRAWRWMRPKEMAVLSAKNRTCRGNSLLLLKHSVNRCKAD